jgi:hypothetical protein
MLQRQQNKEEKKSIKKSHGTKFAYILRRISKSETTKHQDPAICCTKILLHEKTCTSSMKDHHSCLPFSCCPFSIVVDVVPVCG